MPVQTLRSFLDLLAKRFVATRCSQVAGSLTFTTLLALVPLVTVSIALFRHFPAFDELAAALGGFLQKDILPELAGQIITTYALQFSEKAGQLTLIGTVLLVATVLLLLHTIDGVFNEIWGVRKPRPLLTRIAVYWVALTLGPVAIAGSIYATGRLVATSVELIGSSAQIGAWATTLVPLMLLGTLLSFLYLGAPNHPVRLRHALIGGFAAAFAFLLMQRLFGQFVARFPTYTLVYGTFAALPIFLIWLYLSWVTVLLGAILAATLPELQNQRERVASYPGSRVLAAAHLLRALALAQRAGTPSQLEALLEQPGCSHRDTEGVLEEMADAGWIARTEDEKWVLVCDPEGLTVRNVFEHFAFSTRHAEETPGPVASEITHRIDHALRDADLSIARLADEAHTPRASAHGRSGKRVQPG